MKADLRVTLSKLEDREKRENRRLTIVGTLVAAASGVISAVVSYLSQG